MKKKILFVGLDFALNNYFSNHIELLNSEYIVCKIAIDSSTSGIKNYSRRSLFSLPKEFLFCRSKINEIKPDIVITVGPKIGVIFSLLRKFSKKFRYCHWFTGQVWGYKRYPKVTLSYWADCLIINSADVLYCDGHTQSQFIKANIRTSKNISVPGCGSVNGLRLSFCSGKPKKLLSEVKKIVFIGRKSLDKGLDLIIELASSYNQIEFVIAGPVDESFPNYEIWKKSRILSNTTFIDGFVDPVLLLESSDLMILPSLREGFGNIMIESQSQGVPVICSNIYGLKDAFIEGTTGISCSNDNINEYKNAIERFSEPDFYNFASLNSIEFSKKFHPSIFKENLKNLYTQTLTG